VGCHPGRSGNAVVRDAAPPQRPHPQPRRQFSLDVLVDLTALAGLTLRTEITRRAVEIIDLVDVRVGSVRSNDPDLLVSLAA